MDLHADQIQGFFEKPVDHLYASSIFVPYIKSLNINNLIIASPDMGGSKRAYAYSKFLDADVVICYKQRSKGNVITHMELIGDVSGKNVILIDDMIDTAGTLIEGVNALKREGAERIFSCATHGILSDPALERITECEHLERVIITDTIPATEEILNNSKIEVLSISNLIAKAIYRTFRNDSVSSLFT